MEGLAKTSEISKPVAVAPKDPASISMGVIHNDIPVGVYMFYDRPIDTTNKADIDQMKELYDYAKASTNGSDGDVLMFLSQLDRKLGVPTGGSSRINKAYNYTVMSKKIQDLDKQRTALTQ